MFIQCSTVKRKGKVSRNRKLAESYRDPKTRQPRVRTVQNIESLPIAERAKIIYNYGGQKHLTAEEWQVLNELGLLGEGQVDLHTGDVFRGAGSAVAFEHMKASGMLKVLDQHLSRSSFEVVKELVIHQLLYPQSKVKFAQHRSSSLLYLLAGKRDYKEDKVYQALDELAGNFETIKHRLTDNLEAPSSRLLLYDLSNSYFTGTKAELGGRGLSKEKRHDRYIVSYGLVMDQHNMPLDIRIWEGGTADTETVLATFAEWKKAYNADQGVWVGDRSMSGAPTLQQLTSLELNYITGLPGNTQQAVLQLKQERQPELFDRQDITSFRHEGQRYVLCRHQQKGYRRERQNLLARRKVYEELTKIRNSRHNKDDKKLYHRAMRVLEQHEQTRFWDIHVAAGQDSASGYVLNFRLNRQAAVSADRRGHYYLLQTDLTETQMPDQQVLDSYKALMQVEQSFRDIKSYVQLRPIRHWRQRRIEAHLYLCYLSLWLSKYIENKWNARNITTRVAPTLQKWDHQLLVCELLDSNQNLVEVKWNQGANAAEALQQIKAYGEADAIKPYE